MSLARRMGPGPRHYLESITPSPTRFPNVESRPWMRTQSPWYWDMMGGNQAQEPYVGSGSTGMGYGGWAGLSYLPPPGAQWGLSQASGDIRQDRNPAGVLQVGPRLVRDMNGGSMLRRGPAFPRTVLGARSATTYGDWGKYDLDAIQAQYEADHPTNSYNPGESGARPPSVGELAARASALYSKTLGSGKATLAEMVAANKAQAAVDAAAEAQAVADQLAAQQSADTAAAQAEADRLAAEADLALASAESADSMTTMLMVGAGIVAVGALYLVFGRK